MILPLIKIIFLSHGNVFDPIDTPYLAGSKTNLSLSRQGSEQAETVARYLEQNHLIPDHIYTGPQKQHLETTDILATHFNAPVIQAAALNELDYGEWEGKTEAELLEKFPESYQAWCEQAIWPHLLAHQQLLKKWLETLSQNAEPTSTVLAVTSGGLLKILLTLLPDLALHLFENHAFAHYEVKTGNFCILEYDTFARKLTIKDWNVAA